MTFEVKIWSLPVEDLFLRVGRYNRNSLTLLWDYTAGFASRLQRVGCTTSAGVGR
jgi:hypothetical protein